MRLANGVIDERLARMNEFRDAMNDQARMFARVEQMHLVEERLKFLELKASNLDGRIAMFAAGLTVRIEPP